MNPGPSKSPATRRRHAGPLVRVACLGLGIAALTGCISRIAGDGTTPDQAANDLRAQNQQLAEQVDKLQKQIDLRLAEIDALKQQAHGAQAMPGVETPHLVALKFDRYTSAIDTNHDKIDDTIRLYLQTLDQDGRFLPVAGKAVVQAVLITPGQPPTTLAEKTFDPPAFNQAYRSGLTGTHYTLDLPLPSPLPRGIKEATVKVTFTDASTGASFAQEMPVSIQGAP